MQEMIEIKLRNISENELPAYVTEGAAGADIRASIDSPVEILPGYRSLISTGIFAEIPKGYEIQVRPRSGLAVKHGITCLNTPGTIDSDYRGEIKILLINLGQEKFVINSGDRIAQLVVAKAEQANFVFVEELNSTGRAGGGFGHTGLK